MSGLVHATTGPGLDSISILSDDSFDERLPADLRVRASTFFTPVHVAECAARLLTTSPGTTVLDVGAGAGKFCIAAALAVPSCKFIGVEWRPHLVALANALADELAVPNVRFIHGDALDLDWSSFDSFYFFNPFAEQSDESEFRLDRTIDVDPDNFIRCVYGAREKLASARVGTRVVTYHGFGASPPRGYEPSREDPVHCRRLQLWVKTQIIMGGETYAELV